MTTIIVAVVAVVATLLIAVPITSKVSVDNKVKTQKRLGQLKKRPEASLMKP